LIKNLLIFLIALSGCSTTVDDESYYPDSSKMIIGCMQQPAGHRPVTHEGRVIERSNDYFDCLEYQENQFEIKKIYSERNKEKELNLKIEKKKKVDDIDIKKLDINYPKIKTNNEPEDGDQDSSE
jgi:hypothetical protein